MIQTTWRTALICSVLLSLVFISCDEPNDPDLPSQPYKRIAVLSSTTVIKDVAASGDIVAVAAGSSGAYVLNVRDAAHPETLFTYATNVYGAQCTDIALDTLHRYVAVRVLSEPDWGPFPLFNYTAEDLAQAYVAQVGGNGPYDDLECEAFTDSIRFYGSDNNDNFFTMSNFCRASSESPWSYCPQILQLYQPVTGTCEGFDTSADGLLAIAIYSQGVHIHNLRTRMPLGNCFTPGFAQDCAWKGSTILIADRYHMTIMDAGNLENPRVVGTFVIPGADRLSRILVSGDYACLMDDNDGVYVLDIRNPASPSLIQTIPLTEPADIMVSGNRLYIIDEADGLLVYSR